MHALDGVFQQVEVVCEGEGAIVNLSSFRVQVFDGVEEKDLGRVASGGFQTRFEGILRAIFGGDEDDATLLARRAIGHEPAG